MLLQPCHKGRCPLPLPAGKFQLLASTPGRNTDIGKIGHQNLSTITKGSFIIKILPVLRPAAISGDLESSISRAVATAESIYLQTEKAMVLFNQQVDGFVDLTGLQHRNFTLVLVSKKAESQSWMWL